MKKIILQKLLDKKQDIFASFRARDEAKNKLWYIINEIEK